MFEKSTQYVTLTLYLKGEKSMSRRKKVDKSQRKPLMIGKTYWNETGESRTIKNMTPAKFSALKIVYWEGNRKGDEGASGEDIFYDWLEGNYDDGSRKRRKKKSWEKQ